MSSIRIKRGIVAAATGLGLVAAPLAFTPGAVADDAAARAAAKPDTLKLDLFALNDFHGQLEPGSIDTRPGRSGTGEVHVGTTEYTAGGAAYLATHLKEMRQESRGRGAKPLTVAAGDLVGATPLNSAAFHDEPTVEALNLAGLKVSSVGNHEFDEGYKELKRLQRGGCLDDGANGANNQNSCPDPENPFEGADFQYLAANVKKVSTGKPILPPYTLKKVGDKKVAFIGMTLEGTPDIVTAAGIQGLKFTDEVNTVNNLVPRIQKQGVQAIVVLLHQGVAPSPITDLDGCAGEVTDDPGYVIGQELHPAVDLVVSGHTHQPYVCTVKDPNGRNRLVTSAYANGRVVTEINLELRPRSGDVIRKSVAATNHVVTNGDGTEANQAVLDLIDRYNVLVQPIASKVLGQVAPADTQDTVSKTADPDGRDSPLGNLIADSQKVDPSTVPTTGDAAGDKPVVAFMNPGGIRDNLVENADKNVTFGAAFAVQPFNNYVVSMDLTGAQILQVLHEQFNGRNEASPIVLQVSGLKYTWDTSDAALADTDAVVDPVLIDENGDGNVTEELDPAKVYRVVANSFLAGGGDGFPTLAQGENVFFGGLDIDSLAGFLALPENQPYTQPATDRITSQP